MKNQRFSLFYLGSNVGNTCVMYGGNMFRMCGWDTIQKQSVRMGSVFFIMFFSSALYGYNWIQDAVDSAYIAPRVQRIDIHNWSEKNMDTEVDLSILSEQTGVHPAVLAELVKREEWEQIQMLQEKYFAPVIVESTKTTPVTISEHLVNEKGQPTTGMLFADIQNGDILITKNSRCLGWRNGHVGLVVNAEAGEVLEAIMIGTNTKISSLKKWSGYPSFLVLRLKEQYCISEKNEKKDDMTISGNGTREKRQTYIPEIVAEYAREELKDIPYDLLAGIGDRVFSGKVSAGQTYDEKGISSLSGTQCAHLIWYAYMQEGIDLDSNGGFVVTPQDIQKSEFLEIIQTYGY